MSKPASPSRRHFLTLTAGVVFAGPTAALAQAVPPRSGPGLSGRGRVWVYRILTPDDTQGMPPVWINGAFVGYAEPGTSFYRDVPAGPVEVAVDTYTPGLFRPETVAVAPGQEFYFQIMSLPHFEESGNKVGYRRGTYRAMLVEPRIAALQLPQTQFRGGA